MKRRRRSVRKRNRQRLARTRDGCDERNSKGHIYLLVVTTRVEAAADLNPAAAFPFEGINGALR
jgi:hypothetical protein